ncbi:MAG: EthD family reductase [Mycobacteriales bacterium]
MTHRLLVQYGQPTDPAAFDQHYRDVHVPLARQIPGLQRYTLAHPVAVGDGPAPYLVAELDFASEADFGAGLGSPQGQAAAGDVPNFATGGATMSHFDVEDVTS